MRLDGRPVPAVEAEPPVPPRSAEIVGIELSSEGGAGRFVDGRAMDRLVVKVLSRGGRMETVEAIVAGLAGLAAGQGEDGGWARPGESPVRATGLAVLSCLAAGRTHRAGEYRKVVRDGLKYLKQHQDRDGRFAADPVDHAAATWAMAKAYTLTRSPLMKQSAQAGLGALSPDGGAFTVLARAEGAQSGLLPDAKPGDTAAALREVLAGATDEDHPRHLLLLAERWLFD
jgi:hypothetical protein